MCRAKFVFGKIQHIAYIKRLTDPAVGFGLNRGDEIGRITETGMMYDIFFSYSHADKDEVMPICSVLSAELEVWIDKAKVKDGESITGSAVEGLTQSKVLLAYYSPNYLCSRACQWELTAAFLASQQEGDPRRRVLVINPEEDAEHIQPVELRDARYRPVSVPASPDEIHEIVESVKAHVDGITGVFGEIRALKPPWYGRKGVGYSRFVGRLSYLWQIHSALHASEYSVITGAPAASSVNYVHGMGGVGKSLLAEEYALRYGAAFPGGVFWLSAFGNDDSMTGVGADERKAERGHGRLWKRCLRQDDGYLEMSTQTP